MTTPSILDPFVESSVEAFESTFAEHPDARIESFLPPKNHEKYFTTASELVRVEMDLAWSRGDRRMLAEFQARFPELFADDTCREQLAFEEFRLRRLAGDDVSLQEYESQLQVDTASWSSWLGYDEVDSAGSVDHPARDSTLGCNDSTTADLPKDTRVEQLRAGSPWNGFEIVRSLGEGSFGQTFLARQNALGGRDVVLKFSDFDSAEAQKLARLQHTNITPVFSVHRSSTGSVMCMPFLGSATLANLTNELRNAELPRSGKFILKGIDDWLPRPAESEQVSEARRFFAENSYTRSILWIAARLADGLQHSHERGILHRDVKPANVLIRDDGEPLLIDFNLAADRNRKLASTAGGTLPYMSPEQIQAYLTGSISDAIPFDGRGDVYSLGVCMYQLLTGRMPYTNSKDQCTNAGVDEQSLRSRRQKPESLNRHNPDVTPAVQAIVDRCLAFDASDRYQSAAELRDDLLRHLDDQPLRFARNSSLREWIDKWVRRNPGLFSYSTAATVLAIATLVMFGAWKVRERQVAAVRASNALHELQDGLNAMRPALAAVGMQGFKAAPVSTSAASLAESLHVPDGPSKNPHWNSLSASQKSAWRRSARTLSYLLAKSAAYAASSRSDADTRTAGFQEALLWSDVADKWSDESIDFVIDKQRQRIEKAITPSAPPADDEDLSPPRLGKSTADNALDHLLIGMERYQAHDLKGATQSFRKATQLAPQDPTGWLRLADALMLQGENASALACFDVCSTLLPDSDFVLFHRGLCYLHNGQPHESIADFTRTIELRPQLEAVWLNRALAHIAAGEQEAALADLNHIIEHGAENPRAYFVRSRLLRDMRRFESSVLDLQQGLERRPSDELGWIARGIAHISTQPKQALEDFQQALQLNSRSGEALNNIAHVYAEQLNMPREALKALNRSLEIDNSDTLARAGRGVMLARLGRIEEALADAANLLGEQIDAVTRYQVACIFALASTANGRHAEQSIGVLLESLAEDFALLELVETDPDLDNIRADEDFQQGIAAVESLRDLMNNNSARN